MSYPTPTVHAVSELLRGLDASQREAVTSPSAPLAILAGAGSGKTRVLTRRIAFQASEGATDPRHVLAVTFTRKAAGELRARLSRLDVQHAVTAGTFHAIALAQLRRRVDDAGRAMPTLLERKVRVLIPLLGGAARGREAGLAAAEVASEIEWAKARLVTPDGFARAAAAAGRDLPRPPDEIAEIYRAYEREKRRRRLVDFDDLIAGCADALERDPEFAAAQRWRFRHLYVDEFQDATPAQFRLLRAWLGDRSDLCVVGDGDQAVYAFAGAEPSFLTHFRRHFDPGDHPNVGVVRLGSNYRSTPQIVAAATSVLGPPGRARPSVVAAKADGPVPVVTAYPSDDDEAAGIVKLITREPRRHDRQWSRNAVLYRVNAQSALFEEALTRAGIPFRVRGGVRFLDRPEVQVALDELRTATRTAPGRRFEEHLTDLVAAAQELSEERREHADALVRLGREYLDTEGRPGSVDGFINFLHTALRNDDGDDRTDAVQLLTFHRAKGLEFDTVFVTGVERGLVPISHAKTPEALDEEQRLLYVALSRAEHTLHVSWARRRTVGMRTSNRTAELLVDARRAGDRSARGPRARAGRRPEAAHRRRARPRGEREGCHQRTKGPGREPASGRRAALRRVGRMATAHLAGVGYPRLRGVPRHHARRGRRGEAAHPRRPARGGGHRPDQGRALRSGGARARGRPRRGPARAVPAERLTRRPRTATIDDDDTSVEHGGRAMVTSTLPLYPTDDGWPYPDAVGVELAVDDEIDLDALELRVDPHAFADLTELEHYVVAHRYGLSCAPCSMKDLARELGCSHAEARDVLGAALDKLRTRLTSP